MDDVCAFLDPGNKEACQRCTAHYFTYPLHSDQLERGCLNTPVPLWRRLSNWTRGNLHVQCIGMIWPALATEPAVAVGALIKVLLIDPYKRNFNILVDAMAKGSFTPENMCWDLAMRYLFPTPFMIKRACQFVTKAWKDTAKCLALEMQVQKLCFFIAIKFHSIRKCLRGSLWTCTLSSQYNCSRYWH